MISIFLKRENKCNIFLYKFCGDNNFIDNHYHLICMKGFLQFANAKIAQEFFINGNIEGAYAMINVLES